MKYLQTVMMHFKMNLRISQSDSLKFIDDVTGFVDEREVGVGPPCRAPGARRRTAEEHLLRRFEDPIGGTREAVGARQQVTDETRRRDRRPQRVERGTQRGIGADDLRVERVDEVTRVCERAREP
jgi:hypothetical protein